jgi:hypothetical protein
LFLFIAHSGKVCTQKQSVSNKTTYPPTQKSTGGGSIPVSLLPAAILVLVAGKATACWPTSSPEQGRTACSACRAGRGCAPAASSAGREEGPPSRTTPPACVAGPGPGEIRLPRLRAERDLRQDAAVHGRKLRRLGELAAGGGAAARGAWAHSFLTAANA